MSTYQNTKYGFAFDFPADWKKAFPQPGLNYKDLIVNVRLEGPDPDPNLLDDTPYFQVAVSKVSSYLDSTDLKVKNTTAEAYGRSQALVIAAFTGVDILPASNEITKNEATSIAGKGDAWRVDHIDSVMGRQLTFSIDGFVTKNNNGMLYELELTRGAFNIPKTLPIGEKILQSFRFT